MNIMKIFKTVLPHLARLCLVSTFINVAVKSWLEWEDQSEFLVISWGCTQNTVISFLVLNLVGHVTSVALVLAKLCVGKACLSLFCLSLIQGIAYQEILERQFLFRLFLLLGSLLLVVAESLVQEKSAYGGVPSLGENISKKYFLLAGRILMLFMFETVLTFETSVNQIIQNVVGTLLMLSFTIGYKTRLSACLMVGWLTVLNFSQNAWWKVNDNEARRIIQYEFFQWISVVGGLLMMVSLGAGGVSIDEQKKKW